MTAALIEQSPLRACAARAGGVIPLCRALGVSRQTFYDAEREGGFSAVVAIAAARLTGAELYPLAREADWTTLDVICDYFANRSK